MGRILSIDYGTKRTGIAVSDPLRIIASPLDTVPTHQLASFLTKYLNQNIVDIIVIGKPLQSDGSASATLPAVNTLYEKLKKLFPQTIIALYDERYTSVMAKDAMLAGGLGKMARRDRSMVDKISAAIILQGFMESRCYEELKSQERK